MDRGMKRAVKVFAIFAAGAVAGVAAFLAWDYKQRNATGVEHFEAGRE
jgi:hypothetical protein